MLPRGHVEVHMTTISHPLHMSRLWYRAARQKSHFTKTTTPNNNRNHLNSLKHKWGNVLRSDEIQGERFDCNSKCNHLKKKKQLLSHSVLVKTTPVENDSHYCSYFGGRLHKKCLSELFFFLLNNSACVDFLSCIVPIS